MNLDGSVNEVATSWMTGFGQVIFSSLITSIPALGPCQRFSQWILETHPRG
jgi:hypothetical protein